MKEPYIEVYLGNLGGRGAPAVEFGKLVLAMHKLLAKMTEQDAFSNMVPVLAEPAMGVEVGREGYELAIAANLEIRDTPRESGA